MDVWILFLGMFISVDVCTMLVCMGELEWTVIHDEAEYIFLKEIVNTPVYVFHHQLCIEMCKQGIINGRYRDLMMIRNIVGQDSWNGSKK